jgi:hypothetical protein
MMQKSELNKRFIRIEQDIDDALHSCEENIKFPRNLKESVMQWKRQTLHAKAAFDSNDNFQIHFCVDELQRTGKKALAALDEIIGPDTRIRNSVMHANSELADLKWQLH